MLLVILRLLFGPTCSQRRR